MEAFPRHSYFDTAWAKRVLDKLRDLLEEHCEASNATQGYFATTHGYILDIALLRYALGRPLHEVLAALKDAADVYQRILDLRGTESPFPAYHAVFDPTKDPKDPASLISYEPMFKEGEKDYSYTNSRDSYLAVCTALSAGTDDLARELAEGIWDPPNAKYIFNTSETCTPADQHLGYALREYFAGNEKEALDYLGRIRPRVERHDHIGWERDMFKGLIERNPKGFIDGLTSLLRNHDRMARHKYHRQDPDYFLCLRGLGLCRLALQRGVIELADLPKDNPYLPLELLPPET